MATTTVSKGDRTWLCLCTATGVAVDVTLNKYSSILPWQAVVSLWLIPAVLFIIWFWKVERTASWVKHRFLEHPISYCLMFLIFIPVAYGATGEMIAKFSVKTHTSVASTASEPTQPKIVLPPTATPNGQKQPTSQPPPKRALDHHQHVNTGVHGSENTQMNDVRPVLGDKNTILGPTDTHGNSIYTTPGAYGYDAHAGPGSIAIGAHAGAGQQAPTYQQNCQGSACAQGPNSQATFNQFGEPERKIASKYVNEIAPVLAANPGTASIRSNTNSDQLAQQLFEILKDANWKPISIGPIIAGRSLPPGVVVSWRGPSVLPNTAVQVPNDRPDVRALIYALSNSGIKELTVAPSPDLPEHTINVEIGGIPK